MKNLKVLWQNNKVVIVLVAILIICFIAICFIAGTYFIGGDSSVYGDRLEGADSYKISASAENDYIDAVKENETVEDVGFKVHGKVIYIDAKFVFGADLEESKSVMTASLENIDDKLFEFYDLNFTISSDETVDTDGFIIMGAKNINSDIIVWNNNTPVEESE